ncbi:hypothetical protein PF005_g4374 [Phytophthora fragariae]|uniref:Uncharacterized protein n=1 Tax=Phytophthora fragariae TaxID=53985 RepID=A0A6A3Z1F8_9STRA|nr:hypothetical protein PF003_g16349 [Phytophthora fragariae]KAE8936883.1 hypothetical protein PF009_g13203 [Phytophthora fragariae]KAE9008160.1 hypothetical protein PF011_g10815 [Phytophthora fragariae]KAE9109150.1 hypothetical protein PF007_g12364 [Phytophthora fragariae]KAE9121675.1 hypothetical protein PF010_g7010 [Phytophthora fragariae]
METVVLAAASSSVDIGPALLLLLANNEHRERPERPIIPSNRFVLSSKSDVNCVKDFRFERAAIYQLVELFTSSWSYLGYLSMSSPLIATGCTAQRHYAYSSIAQTTHDGTTMF